MGRDEIREIAEIVGGDETYRHFVKRINKEFEASGAERNANVYVIFVESAKGKKVGFSVIGESAAKMAVWQKTFREEGWVDGDFAMAENPLELMYMYLKPQYRNKGYGGKLFKRTFKFVKSRNAREVYAYVGDKTPQALNFYKSMQAEVISDFSDEEVASAFLRWKI
jgi:GNAT superfamily N-acetyltransferase